MKNLQIIIVSILFALNLAPASAGALEQSDKLAIKHLLQTESFVSRVYHDSRQLLTTGVGHLLTAKEAKSLGIRVALHSNGMGWTALDEPNVFPNDSFLERENLKAGDLIGTFLDDYYKHRNIAKRTFGNKWHTFNKYMKVAMIDHAFQLGGFSDWPALVSEAKDGKHPLYTAMQDNYRASLNYEQTTNRVKARIKLLEKAENHNKGSL